ncbi:Initiation-specific alpha-16-mannosyltransferase [Pyrenophora seminiperda CCB06]|uniref:Initiation-specific alpha-16-mannosyltransferase n=1 Tax=Pyrenophora seminiperda CCB06 TaxID=1302712 RepID=A0A3M7M6N0_9PLEO|nr:Initiation-specific alpha-16-mannosyltransferase [Pyrenophora seminiperda CCB06]
MLLRPLQLSKVFTYHALIALCIIVLIYHFVSTQDRFLIRIPGAPGTAQHSEFPKLIWYKLGPNGLSEETRNWTESCVKRNSNYKAHFMTDEGSDEYVRTAFASRPDIVDNYLALPVPIYKADFLRYLLLWDQGGIWSDLDVSCESPIDEWVPAEYRDNATLVVGWEFDQGWEGVYIRQFASWTLLAKPRSPHMMQVIEDILQTLREKTAEHKISVENATLDIMGDVVDFTGPRRLTRSVYKSLGNMLNRTIDAGDMQELVRPKLVGDVLVMPGRSFAASANNYKPEQEPLLPPKLVTHHYAGSWKNNKGGER